MLYILVVEDRKFKRTFLLPKALRQGSRSPTESALGSICRTLKADLSAEVPLRRDCLGVFPCNQPLNLGSEKLWRSRSPRPWSPGRLKRVGWRVSGRLQLRPTGWRARRRPGLQTQVREDLLDHRLLQDCRDDLQLAAAVRAVRHVDLEHALEQKRLSTAARSAPLTQ